MSLHTDYLRLAYPAPVLRDFDGLADSQVSNVIGDRQCDDFTTFEDITTAMKHLTVVCNAIEVSELRRRLGVVHLCLAPPPPCWQTVAPSARAYCVCRRIRGTRSSPSSTNHVHKLTMRPTFVIDTPRTSTYANTAATKLYVTCCEIILTEHF